MHTVLPAFHHSGLHEVMPQLGPWVSGARDHDARYHNAAPCPPRVTGVRVCALHPPPCHAGHVPAAASAGSWLWEGQQQLWEGQAAEWYCVSCSQRQWGSRNSQWQESNVIAAFVVALRRNSHQVVILIRRALVCIDVVGGLPVP
jgi:hypothetical protein